MHSGSKAKDELKNVPLSYTKELAKEYCTDKIDCYLVKLQIDKMGHAMYGYLFYPKNAKQGSHPVVLTPPGAGIKTIKEPCATSIMPRTDSSASR